jgi:hypothetical protein
MGNYLLFFAVWICIAASCVREESENYHRTIRVTNHSDHTIYINAVWLGQGYTPVEYPWGASGNKISGGWMWQPENKVNPGETNSDAMDTGRPSDSIEGVMIVYKHIKVFFVDAAKYDQIPVPQYQTKRFWIVVLTISRLCGQ